MCFFFTVRQLFVWPLRFKDSTLSEFVRQHVLQTGLGYYVDVYIVLFLFFGDFLCFRCFPMFHWFLHHLPFRQRGLPGERHQACRGLACARGRLASTSALTLERGRRTSTLLSALHCCLSSMLSMHCLWYTLSLAYLCSTLYL